MNLMHTDSAEIIIIIIFKMQLLNVIFSVKVPFNLDRVSVPSPIVLIC